MEKQSWFKSLIWAIVFSLVISLLPVDLFIAHAETDEDVPVDINEKKDNKKQKDKEELLKAPKDVDQSDLKSIDDLNNETTIVESKDENKYQATFYDDEVRMETDKGFEDIDANIKLNDGVFETENTELDLNFAPTIETNEPFINVIDDKDDTLVTLKGIEYKNKLRNPKSRRAEVKDNVIWHRGVFPNIDIRHVTLNKEVKEDVVINNKQNNIEAIVYEIDTDKEVVLTDNDEIEFRDKDGKVAFKMPKPEMSDSNIDEQSGFAEKSYDIEYKLFKSNGKYILKVIPSLKWLNAKDRVYPVYIDPTFSKDVTLDTFVSSAQPTTNLNKYWNSTLGLYTLRVGKYDTSTGTNYTFLKFPSMSYLKGATISSAKLQSFSRWNYYGTTKTAVWADKVNASWSETGVTWNTKPTSTNITNATAATNEWLNFNVLSYAKGIAEGKVDYGLKLHTNGNGQTYWKQLSASENATNKSKISVVYSYPKMDSIQTTPYIITGTKNGYINVTWPSMLGAKAYKLQLFDGKGWQTVYTGASTSYNTKDKKIWPTTAQYATKDSTTGGIKFRNGDGTDLPIDPSSFYTASRGTTSTDKTFQFRVIADYALGSGLPSDADRQSIMELIPDAPELPTLKNAVADTNDKATIDISWPGVAGASSYNIFIYNGTEYEKIDNVTGTSWSSKGKNIFPNETQLKALTMGEKGSLRENKDGVQLPGDPSTLYKLVNTKYANSKRYYIKVTASSGKGESAGSPILSVYVPTNNVSATVNGYSDNRKEDSGFLFASWNKVIGAEGYGVYLFNGKDYELVDILDKDTTTWHSRDKKLWPTDSSKYQLNIDGVVGGGRELPLDPSATYVSAGGDADNKYRVKITSFRYKGTSTGKIEPYYKGESNFDKTEEKEVEIQKEVSPDYGDEAFYPTIDTDLGTFNTFNRNQVLSESDASLPGRGPEIDATRTFNSKVNKTGMFGLGWQSGFERKLNIEDTSITPKVVQYTEEDGTNHLFVNQSGKLLAPTGVDYEFNIENDEYVIQDESGQREIYGKDGLLDRIEYDAKQADKKNTVKLNYSEIEGIKRLDSITSASDTAESKNRISFDYNEQNLVSKMTVSASSDDKQAERVYTYQYDKFKRLTSVTGPEGDYTYSYREKYAVNEDGEEVTPEEVKYAGEIDQYGMPGNVDGSNQITATYDEDLLTSTKDESGIVTNYNISEEENGAIVEVTGEERAKEKYTFDKYGNLTESLINGETDKLTKSEWLDHRITKTTYPDGEVEVSEYGKRESASKSDQELDGQVLKEKDATTQTTYEYANNKDDVIATTDEHNVKEEVALNSDREEVTDYSVQDGIVGFTEYNQFGNETRTGISLGAGSNLLVGGAFESTNQFSAGKLVDGGVHGKALQLTGETAKQEVTLKAGQPINISGSFKADKSAKGSINVKFMDSTSKVLSTVTIDSPKADSKWVRKLEEDVAPTGTTKASVELTSTTGTINFDEVQLETAQAGHSTSVTPFNFAEQGGFNKSDKWTLTSGSTNNNGFENSEALLLSAGGTASQKVSVIQDTAKPIYVTALSKNANVEDKIKAVVTFNDGTTTTEEKAFQTLDQNNDVWQRQTLQFNVDNKLPIKTVDVTLSNKDGDTLFDGVRVTEGRAVEETTYDKQNNFVTKESGLSKVPVVYENDAFGNVLSTTQGTKKRINEYDNKDNLVKTTAENGAVISYDFNKKNEVIAKHFEGQDTEYTYSKNRISSVKTADDQITKYSYNEKTGDVSRIDLPSGKSIVTKYDSEGNEKAVNNGTTDLFTYDYDKAGNLSNVKDVENNQSKVYTYETDTNGTAGNGAGRLLSITDYFGLVQSYEYVTGIDGVNTELPASMVFNGTKTSYGYDKATRLDKVEVGTNKWLFRHDELGQVNQIKLPNSSGAVNYKFGENGAVESITSDSKTENVVADQYSYDQYGNMTKKVSNDGTSTYQYDAMDQLTEEKIGDKTNTYTYDKRGNRTGINGTTATFNTMNQLTSFGDEKITYDADGNRTSDGKFDYNWNSLGQLIKLTNKSNNDTWYYQYDEQGRRITKTHNDSTIHYHYDNDTNHLIAESKDGKVIREYVRDQDGNLLGLKIGDQFYNYHKNYRGDIIGITDMSGTQLASYTYDSWGNIVKEEVKDDNLKDQPFRYVSYFFDKESDQYYLMARYYNPKHSVFLSVDPLLSQDETVGMHNGYSYGLNSPVLLIDPDGKAWQSADTTGSGGYGSNNAGGGAAAFGPAISSVVINALKNYKSLKMWMGRKQYIMAKSDMKHILVRHHPKYWDGSVKKNQTFFSKKTTINEIKAIASTVMKQNRGKLSKVKSNSMTQVTGTYKGKKYVLGVSKGHIRQLYPTK